MGSLSPSLRALLEFGYPHPHSKAHLYSNSYSSSPTAFSHNVLKVACQPNSIIKLCESSENLDLPLLSLPRPSSDLGT